MANVFSDAFAAWLFASGALTVDSKGTNTLTAHGSPGNGTAIQGAACVNFNGSSQYFDISDANLQAGFPFKNGDTGKLISVCCKVRLVTTNEVPMAGKLAFGTNNSFGLTWSGGSPFFEKDGGYNNNLGYFPFVNGHEYQIIYTIDNNKNYVIYVYDYTNGGYYTINGFASSNQLDGSNLAFLIGHDANRNYAYGDIGEVVVFNRILNRVEMEAIRAGTYSGPLPGATDFAPHDLTSYTSHSPFVVSNSGSDSNFEAWRAFDNQFDIYHCSTGNTAGAYWLKIDIGTGITKKLYSYAVRVNTYPEPTRAPKNWTLEGSNDNSSWDTIDTRTNQTSWVSGQAREYVCAVYTTTYRYFRLNISANNGDTGYTQVAEFYLFASTSNIFSDAVAAWLFAPGALTSDSKGTNTLTDHGTIAAGTPIQGAPTVYLNGSNKWYEIADADLNSGFPFKNVDSTRLITVVCKFRPSGSNEQPIIGKMAFGTANCFGLNGWFFPYNGGYNNGFGFPGFTAGHEYQIAYTIDGINKLVYVYLYDYTAGTWHWWLNPTFATTLAGSTLPWRIGYDNGRGSYMCGDLGEIAVFNRILSQDEIETIQLGLYGNTVPTGGNDFSAESAAKAVWNFDPPSCLTDSKSTNALSRVNTPVVAINRKQGLTSLITGQGLAGVSCYLEITDANLASGFPLKSGDTTKQITVCGWHYPTSVANGPTLWSKFATSNHRTLALDCIGPNLRILWGTGANSSDSFDTGIPLVANTWFHITVRVDGVNKTLTVTVYNATTKVISTYIGSPGSVLYIGAAPFVIGNRGDEAGYFFVGNTDQVVVFNRIITDVEVASIRGGTFVGVSASVSYTGSLIAKTKISSVYNRDDYSTSLKVKTKISSTTIRPDYIGNLIAKAKISSITEYSYIYDGNLIAKAKISSITERSESIDANLKVRSIISSAYSRPDYSGILLAKAQIKSSFVFMSCMGSLKLITKLTSQRVPPPIEYIGHVRTRSTCQAIYYDVDFFWLCRLGVDTEITSVTDEPGSWNMNKLMRHGDWFSKQGGRQPFLFSERRL